VRKFYCLITLLFLFFFSHGQSIDSIRSKMKAMAEKNGYGIIFVAIEGNAYTAMSRSFTGLYEINPSSERLDTIYLSKELESTASKTALMQVAQQLVGKGVTYRREGKYMASFQCYRIPFFIVTAQDEWNGGRVISSNLWMLREEIEEQAGTPANDRILSLLQKDGEFLLRFHQDKWEAMLRGSAFSQELFTIYRRTLDFAGDPLKAASFIQEFQSKFAKQDIRANEVLVTAVIEQLAQASSTDMLGATDWFGKLWTIYQDRGTTISQANVGFFRNELKMLWQSLNRQRIRMANTGGPHAQQYAYLIAQMMQLPGRQIVYYDFLQDKPMDALAVSEAVRSTVLNDWVARSHPSRYLQMIRFSGDDKTMKLTGTAGLNDILDAADSTGAPILSFMAYENLYFAWLVLPGGMTYYNFAPKVDSLAQILFTAFPYQFKSDFQQDGAHLVRGFGLKDAIPAERKSSALRALWKELLGDSISKALVSHNSGKLVVIPDGILNYIPFNALQDETGSYLLERKQIIYWPSVTSWMILEDAQRVLKVAEPSSPVVVVGDPVFSATYTTTVNGQRAAVKLEPLPGTAAEAKAIAALFNVTPLLQSKAGRSQFTGRPKYKILHLATHGLLNTDDALQSFIALSDGSIYASDLLNEDFLLRARLVVLSACQTGLGDRRSTEPLTLANSFLLGGSNSVVSSLWSVSDDATSALMIEFYKGVAKGLRLSEALQSAQLSLRRTEKWSDPYFWAAFRITGVDSNPVK
jgi:hypothetical protein